MAKARASLPRRLGRPKAGNAALFDDILTEWVRTGGPYGRGLDQAIRAVVTKDCADRENIEVKSLRERLRAALKYVDSEKMMLHAIAVAQGRGVPVPQWLNAELVQTQRRNRAVEAAIVAEPHRLVQDRNYAIGKTKQFLHRQSGRLPEAEAGDKRVRQLIAFIRAFDHILPLDTPISTIDQLFTDSEALIAECLRRQR